MDAGALTPVIVFKPRDAAALLVEGEARGVVGRPGPSKARALGGRRAARTVLP